MKSIIFSTSIFFLFSFQADAQISERSSGYSYVGLGYSLVAFTDGVVSDIYPFLNFRNGSFMTDLNLFYGYRINDDIAIELSPSMIFTTGYDLPGYNYEENGVTKYHIPQDARLFMAPLNINLKYFPFSSSERGDAIKSAYLTIGGGGTYIREEYTNFIYSGNPVNPQGTYEDTKTYTESAWAPDIVFGAGILSTGVFGYGVEVNYRMVFTSRDNSTPLALSRANNFNSINFTIKGTFSF